MTGPGRAHASERARRETPRSPWLRRILLALVLVAAFAIGTALGVALENGPGAKGTQTRERTLRIVTVTVTRP